MPSYKKLDSDVSRGGARKEKQQEEYATAEWKAEFDLDDHASSAGFSSIATPPKKGGFLRLDSDVDEDTAPNGQSGAQGETKKKKHYLKFLTRARKRTASPSSKSRLLLSQNTKSSSKNKKASSLTGAKRSNKEKFKLELKKSTSGDANDQKRDGVSRTRSKADASNKSDTDPFTARETSIETTTTNEVQIATKPPAAEARDDVDQQLNERPSDDEIRDGPPSQDDGEATIQLPRIVRRKVPETILGPFALDIDEPIMHGFEEQAMHQNNQRRDGVATDQMGTIDPSLPPPAWCANIQVVDDSAMETMENEAPALTTSIDDMMSGEPFIPTLGVQRAVSVDAMLGADTASTTAQTDPNQIKSPDRGVSTEALLGSMFGNSPPAQHQRSMSVSDVGGTSANVEAAPYERRTRTPTGTSRGMSTAALLGPTVVPPSTNEDASQAVQDENSPTNTLNMSMSAWRQATACNEESPRNLKITKSVECFESQGLDEKKSLYRMQTSSKKPKNSRPRPETMMSSPGRSAQRRERSGTDEMNASTAAHSKDIKTPAQVKKKIKASKPVRRTSGAVADILASTSSKRQAIDPPVSKAQEKTIHRDDIRSGSPVGKPKEEVVHDIRSKAPKPPRPQSHAVLGTLLGKNKSKSGDISTAKDINSFDQFTPAPPSPPPSPSRPAPPLSPSPSRPFDQYASPSSLSATTRRDIASPRSLMPQGVRSPTKAALASTTSFDKLFGDKPTVIVDSKSNGIDRENKAKPSPRLGPSPELPVTSQQQGKAQSQFFVLTHSVIVIQSGIRAYLARQEALIRMGSIVTIQDNVRRWYYGKCAVEKRAAMKIQCATRQYIALCESMARRGAILSVQAWYRGILVRTEMEYLKWCAVMIQTAWRTHAAQSTFKVVMAQIVLAQSIWRQRLARKVLWQCRYDRDSAIQVQSQWRAYVCAKQLCKRKQDRNATIKIQSQWRALICTKQYHRSRDQITTVQSLVRQRSAKRQLDSSRDAAVIIQKYGRGAISRTQYMSTIASITNAQAFARCTVARIKYVAAIRAAIRLQALARSKAAKRHLDSSRVAAVIIQKFTRASVARMKYVEAIRAAVRLQALARSSTAKKNLDSSRAAAVVVQKFTRASVARMKYVAAIRTAVRLQALARSSAAKRHLHNSRDAAVIIQKYGRGVISRTQYISIIASITNAQAFARCTVARIKYVAAIRAAVRLQALARSNAAKRHLDSSRDAAVIIQKYGRGAISRTQYISTIASITKVQAFARCTVARIKYVAAIRAAVRLQALARSNAAKRHLDSSRDAAVIIQKYGRGAISRTQYISIIASITNAQAFARCTVARIKYVAAIRAAVRLQALARSNAAKRHLNSSRDAAVIIQKYGRGAISRTQYISTIASITKAQAFARCTVARIKYVAAIRAAVRLQALARSNAAKRHLNSSRVAAVVIQKFTRASVARMKYVAAIRAAVRLQALARSNAAKKNLDSSRAAAVVVQKFTRASVARMKYVEATRAAVRLQALARSNAAKKNLDSSRAVAVIIQKFTRASVARMKYVAAIRAAVRLQALARSNAAKRHLDSSRAAAVIIQKFTRASVARMKYVAAIRAAVRLQALARSNAAKRHLDSSRAAAVIIQKFTRASVARMKYVAAIRAAVRLQALARTSAAKRHLHNSIDAAVYIQKCGRGAISRAQYVATIAATIKVQAFARCTVARTKYTTIKRCTIRLQALARTRASKMKYRSVTMSIVKLQTRARRVAAQRRYQAARRVAISSQCYARRSQARRHYLASIDAVVLLQATARMTSTRKSYSTLRLSAISVQSSMRKSIVRRRYRASMKSVTLIQVAIRNTLLRMRREKATIMLQKVCRGHKGRTDATLARKEVDSALTLQKVWRGQKARAKVIIARKEANAAVLIQSSWRRFDASEKFMDIVASVVMIQMHWRKYSAKCKVERARHAVLLIQTSCLQFLSKRRAKEQRRLQLQVQQKQNNAATLIQSAWRQYFCEMTYIDAIIAVTIIQAYTRRFMTKRIYAALIDEKRRKEEEAARRQEAAREAHRKEMAAREERRRQAAERKRLEQKRIEAGKKEAQRRLEAEREAQALLAAEEEAEHKRREQERVEAARVTAEEEAKRAQRVVHPQQSNRVQEVGASPSIKDKIRMFSGTGGTPQRNNVSPMPSYRRSPVPSYRRVNNNQSPKPSLNPAIDSSNESLSPNPAYHSVSNATIKEDVVSPSSLQKSKSSDSVSSIPQSPFNTEFNTEAQLGTSPKPSTFQPINESHSPKPPPYSYSLYRLRNSSPAPFNCHGNMNKTAESVPPKSTIETRGRRSLAQVNVSQDKQESLPVQPSLNSPLTPSTIQPHRSPSPLARPCSRSSISIKSPTSTTTPGSVEISTRFSFDQIKNRFDKKPSGRQPQPSSRLSPPPKQQHRWARVSTASAGKMNASDKVDINAVVDTLKEQQSAGEDLPTSPASRQAGGNADVTPENIAQLPKKKCIPPPAKHISPIPPPQSSHRRIASNGRRAADDSWWKKSRSPSGSDKTQTPYCKEPKKSTSTSDEVGMSTTVDRLKGPTASKDLPLSPPRNQVERKTENTTESLELSPQRHALPPSKKLMSPLPPPRSHHRIPSNGSAADDSWWKASRNPNAFNSSGTQTPNREEPESGSVEIANSPQVSTKSFTSTKDQTSDARSPVRGISIYKAHLNKATHHPPASSSPSPGLRSASLQFLRSASPQFGRSPRSASPQFGRSPNASTAVDNNVRATNQGASPHRNSHTNIMKLKPSSKDSPMLNHVATQRTDERQDSAADRSQPSSSGSLLRLARKTQPPQHNTGQHTTIPSNRRRRDMRVRRLEQGG